MDCDYIYTENGETYGLGNICSVDNFRLDISLGVNIRYPVC